MENLAKKIFDVLNLKMSDSDIKLLDASSKETTDVDDAKIFSFEFIANHRDYGPVVILISANQSLEVFYGDNTSKTQDREASKKWSDLTKHLSNLAQRFRLEFKLKNIKRLKYDLSNIEQDITESYQRIFEGYYGTTKTSYQNQGPAKIVIKHNKPIGEADARFRYIESIFIENADGERFKLPFKKLAGARAMARHVTEGGNPYDLFGLHISEMVKDINTLGGFVRHSKAYEELEEAAGLVETGRLHYNNLRKGLKQIAGKRGYHAYKESWEPSAITEQERDINTIRGMFTERSVDSRIEEALPLLARLQELAEQQKVNESDIDPNAPDVEETWNKIKGWGLKALKGYARRVGMPDEIVDGGYRDAEPLRDEIMGHLYGDDWERELLQRGAFTMEADVTDFSPKSQGGTRAELIANFATSGDPKDAAAARKAGATQKELLGARYAFKKTVKNMPPSVASQIDDVNRLKEFKEFEKWASNLIEGSWAIPDTAKKIRELKKFFDEEQPLGVDALNVTDFLYNIIGDDDLYDKLGDAAEINPDRDARPIVRRWLRRNMPDVAQEVIPIKAVEGMNNELDADDKEHLESPVNKDLDKYAKGKKMGETKMNDLSTYMDEIEGVERKEQKLEVEQVMESKDEEEDFKSLIERTNYLLKK